MAKLFLSAGDEDLAGAHHLQDPVFFNENFELVKFGGGAGLLDDVTAFRGIINADMEFTRAF